VSEYTPYPHSFHGHLFQARMWRENAAAWSLVPSMRWTDSKAGVACFRPGLWDRDWVQGILRVSRDECIRRARLHLELARRKTKAD